MKDSPYIRDIRLVWHFDNLLSDPVYEEGYLAENSFEAPYHECPYRFPKKLDLSRIRFAQSEPFTEEMKHKLTALNKRFEKTKWDRWTKGNYYRWCVENNS